MLQETVLQLKMSCLPGPNFPPVNEPDWAGHALRHVCNQILDLASQRNAKDGDLNRVLECTSYFVLNYCSLANNGERWTFTVANDDAFDLLQPERELRVSRHDRSSLTLYRNRKRKMEFNENSYSDEESCDPNLMRKAAIWEDNWDTYLGQPEPNASLTLNELMLRRAVRPTPFYVNWTKDRRLRKADFKFPLHIDLLPTSADKIAQATSWDTLALDQGCKASIVSAAPKFESDYFGRSSFDPLVAKLKAPERIFGSLQSLLRFFRLPKTEGFVSLPVMISTAHHPTEYTDFIAANQRTSTNNSGLRSVLSYSLKEDVDIVTKQLALDFYRGIATQILPDILVYEYAHTLKQILRETREQVVSGITHPLKTSVNRVQQGVEGLRKTVERQENDYNSGKKPDFNAIKDAAIVAKQHTKAATNRLNLIHFGAALFENSDRLGELKLNAENNRRKEKNGVGFWKMVHDIEPFVASKRDINKKIKIERSESSEFYIPLRFANSPLFSEAHQEKNLIMTMIDEIFENAATHGEPAFHLSDNDVVNVEIDITPTKNGMSVCISNQICLTNDELKDYLILDPPSKFQGVIPNNTSGLALVSQMMSMLSMGELSTRWRKTPFKENNKCSFTVSWESKIDFYNTWVG